MAELSQWIGEDVDARGRASMRFLKLLRMLFKGENHGKVVLPIGD